MSGADRVGSAAGSAKRVLRAALALFAAFAFAYFFSALLRAVTATLSPTFSAELGLGAADLGLLAGAYFFGFAAMQLPLGTALDRWGPKRVLLSLLALAVLGCAAFALARGLWSLILARTLIGVGVSACLMAPLTSYRLHYSPAAQMRANSWMLMTGSLGMLASTLPVQWLLPSLGWRGIFWLVACLLVLAMVLIAVWVPPDAPPAGASTAGQGGYGHIFRHPIFVRSAPLAFVIYGGMVAIQALWAGPWLTQVTGASADQAATGLFVINLCMMFAFLSWGLVMPRLARRGIAIEGLVAWGLLWPLAVLIGVLVWPKSSGAGIWALWCVGCTFVSLTQPAVGQAFSREWAGRALSAFNLIIFAGVFCVQWGIGLAIDAFKSAGWTAPEAFRGAFGVFALFWLFAYLWFLLAPRFMGAGATTQGSSADGPGGTAPTPVNNAANPSST